MIIHKISVNNRKKALEIETSKGSLSLPFAKLGLVPTPKNRIARIAIDPELGRQAVTYALESGEEDSVHLDAFLEYNRDPDFMRNVTLHQLTLDAKKHLKEAGLSKQEIIRRLGTSPSQLYRLLDPANYRKSIDEMFRLLTVLGCQPEVRLARGGARAA